VHSATRPENFLSDKFLHPSSSIWFQVIEDSWLGSFKDESIGSFRLTIDLRMCYQGKVHNDALVAVIVVNEFPSCELSTILKGLYGGRDCFLFALSLDDHIIYLFCLF
jgi:hypothetical protein